MEGTESERVLSAIEIKKQIERFHRQSLPSLVVTP